MYRRQENPIAAKSKTMIQNAFIALLQVKPYTQITVTDICKKADVVRKTFYRNFETKEDILDYVLDNTISQLMKIRILEKNAYEAFLEFFYLICEYKEFFLIFHHNHLLPHIEKRLVSLVQTVDLNRDLLISETDVVLKKYFSYYIVKVLFGVLETWIEENFVQTPQELSLLCENLIRGKYFKL